MYKCTYVATYNCISCRKAMYMHHCIKLCCHMIFHCIDSCENLPRYKYVTIFGETNHFGTTSEMHFIVTYHRYTHTLSKHSDKIPSSTWLILGHAKH